MTFDPNGLEKGLRAGIPENRKQGAASADKQYLATYPEVTDQAQIARVNKVVNSLVGQMHNKDRQFTVRILKSDQINAFTTGGPYIYIYTALLDSIQDNDELAGILGHELGHVDADHVDRLQAQESWIALGSLIARAATKGNDRKLVAESQASANSTFSREHETEADILGALYAARSGYGSRGIATFFDKQIVAQRQYQAQIVAQVKQADENLAALRAQVDLAARRRDAIAYEVARQNYNTYVPKYNQFIAWAQQALKGGSPWLVDHPFDKYRRARVMALADFLEGKIKRKEIVDPITNKVLETIEKVEGKKIDPNDFVRGANVDKTDENQANR